MNCTEDPRITLPDLLSRWVKLEEAADSATCEGDTSQTPTTFPIEGQHLSNDAFFRRCWRPSIVFELIFSVRVVKYWNRLPAHLVLAPSVAIFKNSWTVIGSKSSLQHLCNVCPHSLTIFSILLPQTVNVFPYVFYVHIDITIYIYIKIQKHEVLMLRRVGRKARGVLSRMGLV